MNPKRILCRGIITLAAVILPVSPALALHSGLTGFSQDFLRDYESAQKAVDQNKSAQPLLALLQKYTNELEQAELQVSIGLVYNQRTGVVNPAHAVAHFTTALQYRLPEKTQIEILMWRGNSQEQLKQTTNSLNDYLRGLLACSYHDLSGGWPEIKPPKLPISINSPDPENTERARDYNAYRDRLDFQHFLLTQRYYLTDAVKRLTRQTPDSRAQILEMLGNLTPDNSRFGVILDWLKSENPRPWP
jgi:hypothetical protein